MDCFRYTSVAVFSLFRANPARDGLRGLYRDIARSPQAEPLNTLEGVSYDFSQICARRGIQPPGKPPRPYWDRTRLYNKLEVLGTLSQFVDYHSSSLPHRPTSLPPEEDVQLYITKIISKPGRVSLGEQLETLLDITGNDILGAAHVGFIASRIMARALDSRAYPNIHPDKDALLAWNEKITHFDHWKDKSDTRDAPGDTYYFWTNMFAALFYNSCRVLSRRAYLPLVNHGTELMVFVREHIAHLPTNAKYIESTYLGKAMGELLSRKYLATRRNTERGIDFKTTI